MRVTQSMLSNNMLRNLNSSYLKMSKLQDQITSGKKITRPSDDPVVAVKGMSYRTQLDKVDQFIRNTGEVNAWFDTTDMSLGQAGDALNRVKELVVQAANDTNTADDRAKIKAEIDQIREQLRDLGNTKVADKSIFTGTNTQKMLFVDVQYYDPESIQKHYASLGNSTTPNTQTQAQIDFLDAINSASSPEQVRTYLDGIVAASLTSPLKLVSERVLNTTFEDGDGKIVNPLDAIKSIDIVLSNETAAPVVNVPGATKGTTVEDVITGNIKTRTITVVGDTETEVTTIEMNITSTGSSVQDTTVKAGTEPIKIEVFDGVQLTANFPGADIFGRLDELMGKISEALDPANNPNHDTIQEKLGGVVDVTGQDKKDDLAVLQGILLAARADIGARQNRLDLMTHRLDIHKINVTKQMSENEDTDYAKAITDMTTSEAIHQAALSVGAKIIQQTLVDFIR